MKSSLTKVLHCVGGMPMLGHVIATAKSVGASRLAAVVGPNADAVESFFAKNASAADIFVQAERLGTGHAVMSAKPFYSKENNANIVLYGDTPLIRSETILEIMGLLEGDADLVVLGFEPKEPKGYGRLLMDGDQLEAIREEKDATDDERKVGLCNAGAMGFGAGVLGGLLDSLSDDNAQSEYYLTDCVEHARAAGLSVQVVKGDIADAAGVNSRAQLADIEAMFQTRKREDAMANGVTLVAPETVFFSHDTLLSNDVTVEPNVVFGPGVTVESGAVIKAFSHLEGAKVGANALVGPYARLRPGTDLRENTKVGNFVEVKSAIVAKGSKINHLTYIGDTVIGTGVNIGAGTVTCNYDGFGKHKTTIGDGVFIGSGSLLVAPVKIGNDAYIATGSVITESVEDGALAFGRARQTNKQGRGAELKSQLKAAKEAAALKKANK